MISFITITSSSGWAVRCNGQSLAYGGMSGNVEIKDERVARKID